MKTLFALLLAGMIFTAGAANASVNNLKTTNAFSTAKTAKTVNHHWQHKHHHHKRHHR
jgi:hypothetical protein